MTTTHTPFRLAAVRTLRALVAVAALGGAAACSDDDGEDDEPEIASVRLTVTPASGTAQTFTLRESGSDAVVFRVGANTVTAVALDASNQAIPLESDFELRLVQAVAIQGANEVETPLGNGVTFTKSGTLTGSTLTTTAASATGRPAVARMFHKGEGHSDFDANFSFTVVQ